jgi:hypothetical protein
MKKVELALAYYKETDQLQRYIDAAVEHSYEITIYNKGPIPPKPENPGPKLLSLKRFSLRPHPRFPLGTKIINLPNIGVQTHTYLHHIVHRYESLADITIFVLGSGFRGKKKTHKTEWLLRHARQCRGFASAHIYLSSFDDYNFLMPVYKSGYWKEAVENKKAETRPLGQWITKYTGHQLNKQNRFFVRSTKDTFAVTREVIRQRPLDYWRGLLSQVSNSEEGYNLEVTHFFERAWILILFPSQAPRTHTEHNYPPYTPPAALSWDIERYGDKLY